MNSCPPSIPRFSEKSFRKYEPVLSQLLTVHPNQPVWFCLPGSLNTHTARLRDAMLSHIENRFDSTVDPDNLESIRANVIVKHDGERIFIGTKDQWGQEEQNSSSVEMFKQFDGLSVDNVPVEAVMAFAVLMNLDLLNKASVRFTNIDSQVVLEVQQKITQYPNVIIDMIDPQTFVML